MDRSTRRWVMCGVLAIAAVTIYIGIGSTRSASAQDGGTKGRIVLTFGPGGVLTRDGTLWTFNLEKGVWMTVDEGFQEQGQQTRVHPLPVSSSEIERMESFGFIVTRTGSCWLYNLENNQWEEIGAPPVR